MDAGFKKMWPEYAGIHTFIYKSCLAAILFLFFICALYPIQTRADSIATVDQFDGYSNRVLEKIVDKWEPPQVDGTWRLRLQLSLDDTGKTTVCKVLRSSGYPAIDNYACKVFRDHDAFGTPPYGMPVETYFAIWSDNKNISPKSSNPASAARPTPAKNVASAGAIHNSQTNGGAYKKYLDASVRKIRDSIYVPVQTKPGTYHVTAQIKCDSKGTILSSSIVKGSGDALLDKYVLQGIKRAKAITPPPEGLGDTFNLSFTLHRQ